MLAKTLVLLLVAAHVAIATAEDTSTYYGQKEEGWHWYKDPKTKKPPEEPKPVVPQPAKPVEAEQPKEKKPARFSVEWLKQHYDQIKNDAIDHPDDKDKMAAFLYTQRIILDKAQDFATAAVLMSNTDPLLDETNRIPLDTAAKFAVMRGQSAAKTEALKDLAKKGGIFFFFDSTCSYCTTQQEALDWLAKDHGFTVKNISVDGRGMPGMRNWVRDEGQTKALGLKIMPTTMFIVPPDGYYIISQGYSSSETLGEKILMAAGSKKLIPPELAKQIDIFERGVLTAKDMREPASTADDGDTKAWVKWVQEKLGGKY